MEHLIFYYAACTVGFLSLVSMLVVYRSNRRVLRDLKCLPDVKDRWLRGFIQEHQNLLRTETEIHNPSVYVINRMRGRKIGPWSIHQMKGISWGTFILSFLLFSLQVAAVSRMEIRWLELPFLNRMVDMMNLTVITEISVGLLLLSLRLLIGNGYQEEVIENNLLDYIENRFKNLEKTARIIPLGKIRKKEILNTEEKVRENVAGKIEQGILETAATDSRYKHLLNKEEEEIVKDVIKEFLT